MKAAGLLGELGQDLPEPAVALLKNAEGDEEIPRGVAGIVLGCRCVVTNSRTGKTTEAVVADTGPHDHLGEISVACARAIGVSTGTTHPANGGGASSPTIHYQLFPGKAAVVNGVTYPLQPS